MRKMTSLVIVCLIILFLSACQGMNDEPEVSENDVNDIKEASSMVPKIIEVDLKSKAGDRVGFAELSEGEEGVNIYIEAWDLPPSEHGFHIHEQGICEESSFESAGGHFNPTDRQHGFDHPDGPHVGDLPNLQVEEDGTVTETLVATMATLEIDQDHSLLRDGGTALVIHADPDDYISQPAGDAGERIVCGVIKN